MSDQNGILYSQISSLTENILATIESSNPEEVQKSMTNLTEHIEALKRSVNSNPKASSQSLKDLQEEEILLSQELIKKNRVILEYSGQPLEEVESSEMS